MPSDCQLRSFVRNMKLALALGCTCLVLIGSTDVLSAAEDATAEEEVVQNQSNDAITDVEQEELDVLTDGDESVGSITTAAQLNDSRESEAESAEESVETPDIFIPSENISEDYAVPFPVDI